MNPTLEQRLSDLEARVAMLENVAPSLDVARRASVQKEMSAKEFLLTKTYKSDVEKTLLLAYYLEHMKGMLSFNINDVVGVFLSAKEKKPTNPSDAVAKNAARGFLMDASEKKDGKKAWTLTSTGEKYAEEQLTKK